MYFPRRNTLRVIVDPASAQRADTLVDRADSINACSVALISLAPLAAGRSSSYQLTLKPQTSGTLYYGMAVEPGTRADVNTMSESKTGVGTWMNSTPDRGTGYVSGGWGWRRSAIGGTVTVGNRGGAEVKALLQAADGSRRRCDFRGMGCGRTCG